MYTIFGSFHQTEKRIETLASHEQINETEESLSDMHYETEGMYNGLDTEVAENYRKRKPFNKTMINRIGPTGSFSERRLFSISIALQRRREKQLDPIADKKEFEHE